MNAHELNKFVGAILAALVFAMGLSVLSEIIFEPEKLYEPAYVIAIADENSGLAAEEEEETPFAVLLAAADPASGKAVARVCGACHSFDEGGANGIGPALYGVVGRQIASHEGFNYSSALSTYGADKSWTYEELDEFIEAPQQDVPGTIMGFAGVKDPVQRADLVAYLRSITPDAPPLPEPPAEVAAVDAGDTATDATEGGDAATIETPAEGATEAPAGDAGGEAVEETPGNDGTPGQEDAQAGTEGTFAALVEAANPADGQSAAAICLACHSVNEGEAHKIGPNLHGVYGADVAGKADFDYSQAMREYAGKDDSGKWTLAHLDRYLAAPMDVVPGSRMAFAGVKDDQQRAAIIAWLHSISPDAGGLAAPAATETAAPATGSGDAAAPAVEAAPSQDSNASGDAATPPAEGAGDTQNDAAAPTGTEQQQAAEALSEASEQAAAAPAENVTIEPAQKSQVEVVNPAPAAE